MRWGAAVAIQALTLLMLWVSTLPLFAQAPKPPSLQEQLEAQYPPQTLLAIQKEGILGVVLASSTTCAARYQDGKLLLSGQLSAAASAMIASSVASTSRATSLRPGVA